MTGSKQVNMFRYFGKKCITKYPCRTRKTLRNSSWQYINAFQTVLNKASILLQWRYNDHDGVSNHQPYNCILNRLFRCRSEKTSKLRVTGRCSGNSPVTGEFPAQRSSNAENVSIWWRHHVILAGSGRRYRNTILYDYGDCRETNDNASGTGHEIYTGGIRIHDILHNICEGFGCAFFYHLINS